MNKDQCDHCIHEKRCSLKREPQTDGELCSKELCNSFIDINDFDLDSTDSTIWSEMSWNKYVENSYTYAPQV